MDNHVATVRRTDSEEIRFSVGEYGGKPRVDIRIYYEAPNGEYLPTKKGVSVPMEMLEDFCTAVDELRAAAISKVR